MLGFLETVRKFAKPSTCLEKRDLEVVHRASEVIRLFTKENAKRFVERHTHKPLLVQYGSDVTPLITRETYRSDFEGFSVVRHGKGCHEFLVQRCFLTTLDDHFCGVLEEPLIMERKTGFYHFCAYRQLCKTPRELGHQGLVLIFHKYDGALKKTIERLNAGWHKAFHDDRTEHLGLGRSYRQWLREWVECQGCIAHAFHGGLKRAVLTLTPTKEVLRSSFLVMESCRNGCNLLYKCLGEWLMQVMEFTEESFPSALSLYQLLGVKDFPLDTAVDLEIRYVDSRLLIAARHQDQPNLLSRVLSFYMAVWRFRRADNGRWLIYGAGCRVQSLAELLGLSDLVRFVLDHGHSSYYIGGVLRNNDACVRKLALVAGIISPVADKALALILGDDRLPLMLPEIDAVINAELRKIVDVMDDVWGFLANAVSDELTQLRDQCFISALACAGYTNMHLRHARRGVWALLQGDRQDNLRRLLEGPAPSGSGTLFKIYELLRIDGAVSECLDGLEMLSRASWATLDEESGHRITSALAQAHREYGAGTLQARAQVCSFNVMISMDAKAKKLAVLRLRFNALSKRNVKYFTGRQLFLRELNEEVARQKVIGRYTAPGAAGTIMSRHGARWHALASNVRVDFEQRAKEEQGSLLAELEQKRTALRRKIQELEADIEKESRVRKPLRLSNVRVSREEEVELEALWRDPRFSAKNVMAMDPSQGRRLHPPGDVVRQALESIAVDEVGTADVAHPPWLSFLSWNRDFFVKCVFKISEPEDVDAKFYKLVMALQQPMVACFLALDEIFIPDVAFSDVGYHAAQIQNHDYNFDWFPARFLYTDDGVWSIRSQVEVLPHVEHMHSTVRGRGDWFTWEQALTWFPKVRAAPKAKAKIKKSKLS